MVKRKRHAPKILHAKAKLGARGDLKKAPAAQIMSAKAKLGGQGDLSSSAALLMGAAALLAPRSGMLFDENKKKKKIYGPAWVLQKRSLTGEAGRPNSKALVRAEAQRRLSAGDYPKTLKEFSNRLSRWLARHHSEEPQMSSEVVERTISDLWRARPRG
jgi:hypothetical protein